MKREISEGTINVINDAAYRIATVRGVSITEMVNVQSGKSRDVVEAREEFLVYLRDKVVALKVDTPDGWRYALASDAPDQPEWEPQWEKLSLNHVARLVWANNHTTVLQAIRRGKAKKKAKDAADRERESIVAEGHVA